MIDLQNAEATRLGDFRSSERYKATLGGVQQSLANAASYTDYGYDANGNLVKDLNKDIENETGGEGIEYNHLNLPVKMSVRGQSGTLKGTVEYVYDAGGNKLKKTVHETGKPDKTTLCLFGTYENDVIQFLPHEEGRIRAKFVPDGGTAEQPCEPMIIGWDGDGNEIWSECPPSVPTGNMEFYYDYLLKDHLGNVRAVLTGEEERHAYPAASMELTSTRIGYHPPTVEEAVYSKVAATRTAISGIAGYPADAYTDPNQYVAKVSGAAGGNKVGPGILLKVMAGDRFNVRVSSWYKTAAGQTPGSPGDPLTQLVAAIAGGVAAVGGTHGTAGDIEGSGILTSPVTAFLSGRNGAAAPGRPQAHLNWILLNERFEYVATCSNAELVPAEAVYNNGGTGNNLYLHQLEDLPLTRSGYLCVYVSNETPNIDVFFDNLKVTHIKGPLLEETHCYPFGLTMAGVSSKVAGGTANRYKFNSEEEQRGEFSDGTGLDWLDFGAMV